MKYPPIKVRLNLHQAQDLMRFVATTERNWGLESLVLQEFAVKLLTAVLRHQANQKKLVLYALPIPVAVALHTLMQRRGLNDWLQFLLGDLDQLLVDRGYRRVTI